MCEAPLRLRNGQEIACRVCRQCLSNRVQDWVGRSIAESKVSAACDVVTLTYGADASYQQDHMHAQVLTYSDVQTYLKRLRWYTEGVRFFVAGEYGSAKGRAHWHLICFWNENRPPNLRYNERYIHDVPRQGDTRGGKLWDNGWSYWQPCSPSSILYVCKYVLKSFDSQGMYGMSSKPPLGDGYWQTLARRYVEQGLSPQTLLYSFPESVQRDGKLVQYMLKGSSAYSYLNWFDRLWRIKNRNDNWPQSELMDRYVDERERRARRAVGVPDLLEEEFAARFELERKERNGEWLNAESVASVMLRGNRYRMVKEGT